MKIRSGLSPLQAFLLSFFLTGVGALAPLSVQANIFYRDQRISVDAGLGSPLSPIGHLTNEKDGGRGTAFLVDACHVLTNFHVAFADESKPDQSESSVFVIPGEAPVTALPVIYGDYEAGSVGSNDQDWALLKLSTCLGEKYGWLDLQALSLREAVRTPLLSAGFPSDRNLNQVTLDSECRVYPEALDQTGGWRHDCATRAGNSGGPILVQNESGFKVVALSVTERGQFPEIIRRYDVNLSNGAVPVRSFYAKIRSFLDTKQKK